MIHEAEGGARHRLSHTVPRLNVPDYIFSYGGIDVSVRQFLLLIVGILISINCWVVLRVVGNEYSLGRWMFAGIPVLVTAAWGWIQIHGQPLERWLAVMIRYYSRPRVYVWRQLQQDVERSNQSGKVKARKISLQEGAAGSNEETDETAA
jgi:hypothetical protein